MYKRLELHNHTNESDAVFTCKELTDFMVADHVDAFSLTDHNTISGHYKIENYLKEHPQPYNLGECEFHLAFRADDYEAAHKKHKEMGCICFENEEMGIYFIEDPDGYWLEIVP